MGKYPSGSLYDVGPTLTVAQCHALVLLERRLRDEPEFHYQDYLDGLETMRGGPFVMTLDGDYVRKVRVPQSG